MGEHFDALSAREQSAVADFAYREFDRFVFQTQESEATLRAQSDPDAWRHQLCELIASDPKRILAVMEKTERQRKSRRLLFGFALIES